MAPAGATILPLFSTVPVPLIVPVTIVVESGEKVNDAEPCKSTVPLTWPVPEDVVAAPSAITRVPGASITKLGIRRAPLFCKVPSTVVVEYGLFATNELLLIRVPFTISAPFHMNDPLIVSVMPTGITNKYPEGREKGISAVSVVSSVNV
jgi:hypothetical protein